MWKIRDLIILDTINIKERILSVFDEKFFFDGQQVPVISEECAINKPVGINVYGELVNIGSLAQAQYIVDKKNGVEGGNGTPEAPFISMDKALDYIEAMGPTINVEIVLMGDEGEYEIEAKHFLPITGKLTIRTRTNTMKLSFPTKDSMINISSGIIELKSLAVSVGQSGPEEGISLFGGDISSMILISSEVWLAKYVHLYETYMISSLRMIGSNIVNKDSFCIVINNLGYGATTVSLDKDSEISKRECEFIITNRIDIGKGRGKGKGKGESKKDCTNLWASYPE